MSSPLQILGAVSILVPFTLVQFKLVQPESLAYLLPNLGGSALLAGVAFDGGDWGFLLLEACWAIVTVGGLLKRVRARTQHAETGVATR
ncbi:MAG TPA: hypothetical protein VK486_03150 [Thermoleophilaceae bacterium]|nr:hypothetical protein [Thermoleophilaceae bacterium]